MIVPTPPSGKEWLNKISRWFALHPYWALTLAVLAALGPFLTKPFNVDDPLFIWTAHQIQAHPGNPYGFNVNWYGTMEPMWYVTRNPPLACYYLALAAGIFGWGETALHFTFLLPAVAAIIGAYQLARRFCNHPILAALVTLFTPVFLISSTTVMCDVPMLAFWVWAVVLWVDGTKRNDFGRLAGAGLLIALAVLTKYFGLCLVPLLAAYSLMNQRRLGRWTVYLLIPLAALGVYQLATWMLYGHELISLSASYIVFAKGIYRFSRIVTGLTTLTFTGGCLAGVFFFAPLFWRRRMWTVCLAGAVLLAWACFWNGAWLKTYVLIPGSSWAFVEIQMVFWAIGGVGVLALTVADVWRWRDARAWLLALWIFGTFLFTAFFNWTVNGRSLLPMAPAVGILLARHLEQKVLAGRKAWTRGVVICFIAGAAFALLATCADFLLATAVRRSAQQVCAKYARESRMLWFQGHWGFQYYMNALGASALDFKHSAIKAGDNLAFPRNNTNVFPPYPQKVTTLDVFTIPGPHLLATLNETIGGGFYSSVLGPLPFAFGHVPPEKVFVVALEPINP